MVTKHSFLMDELKELEVGNVKTVYHEGYFCSGKTNSCILGTYTYRLRIRTGRQFEVKHIRVGLAVVYRII